MKIKSRLYISTLAEYQTAFWINVSKELFNEELDLVFLSFDDRSSEMLAQANISFHDIPKLSKIKSKEIKNIEFKKELFNTNNINGLILHERLTFDINDTINLKKKLFLYTECLNEIFKNSLSKDINSILIQELGGFLSVIACFKAARLNNIDNYFIEPSFFRGRIFLTKNSFNAPKIESKTAQEILPEVKDYLKKCLEDNELVIPKKDKHQYTSSIKKILKFSVFKRLITKIIDKYFLKKHQEFGYIYKYVSLHLIAIYNSFFLKKHYASLKDLDKFIYFPLHVPADVALTIRSPEYLDQISLVEYLCSIVEEDIKVVIKEHPAQIGTSDLSRIKRLLRKYDNIFLLDPSTNNYKVMSKCKSVVTINSKSGAEGILLNKPIFVLGNAFYNDSPFVCNIQNLKDLKHALNSPPLTNKNNFSDIENYFQNLWDKTMPGELYVSDVKDIQNITDSIKNLLEKT
tara:strand:- start:9744 stop:11126 length:1383 start_codon:yes stop_codon:yes gene_type:complete